MYKPSKEEVEELSSQGNLVPIYRELPADLETPVSIYLKLQDEGPSFLLESITGGNTVGRYSFIGLRPRSTLTAVGKQVTISKVDSERSVSLDRDTDFLKVLKSEMKKFIPVPVPGLPRFNGGAVGYLSYDAVRSIEQLPDICPDDLGLPEAAYMIADTLVAFDHARQRLVVMVNAEITGDISEVYQRAVARIDEIIARLRAPIPRGEQERYSTQSGKTGDIGDFGSNLSQNEFEEIVLQAKEYIQAGDIFQVVLSQRMTRRTEARAFEIYRALRRLNPSPYMVFMRFPGGLGTPPLHIIAASPEMHVRLENGIAEVRPIAGTRPRGLTPAKDAALGEELMDDEKERAEHVMLVDLGRNDLGRVCDYGSVHVQEMMGMERYSHVMHIVSDVRGNLRKEEDAYSLMRATFPAGTVSGAPKVRAMEIIEELETTRRGIYAGAIGYMSFDGNMDSCIAIRTIVMQGDRVHIQAGGGIVADSSPAKEYQESINKASALIDAVIAAEAEA
jgi:anthranilate synthase component I